MRAMTTQGKAFSVRFVKADGRISYIDRAQLGKMKAGGSQHFNIPFVNIDNRERRRSHITGLLEINKIKISLNR